MLYCKQHITNSKNPLNMFTYLIYEKCRILDKINTVQNKIIAHSIFVSLPKYICIHMFILHILFIVYPIIRKHNIGCFCLKKYKQKLKSVVQYDCTFETFSIMFR